MPTAGSKFRIYPNKKQREIIESTFGCCRCGSVNKHIVLLLVMALVICLFGCHSNTTSDDFDYLYTVSNDGSKWYRLTKDETLAIRELFDSEDFEPYITNLNYDHWFGFRSSYYYEEATNTSKVYAMNIDCGIINKDGKWYIKDCYDKDFDKIREFNNKYHPMPFPTIIDIMEIPYYYSLEKIYGWRRLPYDLLDEELYDYFYDPDSENNIDLGGNYYYFGTDLSIGTIPVSELYDFYGIEYNVENGTLDDLYRELMHEDYINLAMINKEVTINGLKIKLVSSGIYPLLFKMVNYYFIKKVQ